MAPKLQKRKSSGVKKMIKHDKNKEVLPGRIIFSLMGFFYGFSICKYIRSKNAHGFMYQINLNILALKKLNTSGIKNMGIYSYFVFISLYYQINAIGNISLRDNSMRKAIIQILFIHK